MIALIKDVFPYLLGLVVFVFILKEMLPNKRTEQLKNRMKYVSQEYQDIRKQSLDAIIRNKATLKDNQDNIQSRFVAGANLLERFKNETTRIKLQRAGFRKNSHLVNYAFFKVFAPVILFVLSLFYVDLLVNSNAPFAINMLISMGIAFIGFYVPEIYLKNIADKRQKDMSRAWPDAVDILTLCIESGMSSEEAFRKVVSRIDKLSLPLTEELTILVAELSYLTDRKQGFKNLSDRTGIEDIKAVCQGFYQAEAYGMSIAQTLRVLSADAREKRLMKAEEKAAALPPKLTVPLIGFFMPVLFIVIMGPAMIQLFG